MVGLINTVDSEMTQSIDQSSDNYNNKNNNKNTAIIG